MRLSIRLGIKLNTFLVPGVSVALSIKNCKVPKAGIKCLLKFSNLTWCNAEALAALQNKINSCPNFTAYKFNEQAKLYP